MVYLEVVENSPAVLQLRKPIAPRDWAVFAVLELLALYIVFGYVPVDFSFRLKLLLSLYIACLGPWMVEVEQCWITRSSIKTEVTSVLFRSLGIPVRQIVHDEAVTDVTVVSEVLRYYATGHQVVLTLESGREVPLTTTCTLGPKSEHDQVGKTVASWLGVQFETEQEPTAQPGYAGFLEHQLNTKFRDPGALRARTVTVQ